MSHWLPQDGGGEGGGEGTAGGAAAGGAACVIKVGGVTVVSAVPEPAEHKNEAQYLDRSQMHTTIPTKKALQ